MTATTVPRDDKQSRGDLVAASIAAATKILSGTIVAYNTAGLAVAGVDTASFVFAGMATETVDNTAGGAAALKVNVATEGTFELKFGGTATQATVGKTVYIADNQTVNTTTTNSVAVGKVVQFIDAATVRVKIYG